MTVYHPTTEFGGSTHEIFLAFRRHTDRLFELKRKAVDAIDEWGAQLSKRVEDHMLEQKHTVNEAFKARLEYISEMRDHFLRTSDAYEQKNETAEMRRLVENCRKLSMKLAEITYPARDTPFISVLGIKNEEPMNLELIDLSNAHAKPTPRNASDALHEKTFDATHRTRFVAQWSQPAAALAAFRLAEVVVPVRWLERSALERSRKRSSTLPCIIDVRYAP